MYHRQVVLEGLTVEAFDDALTVSLAPLRMAYIYIPIGSSELRLHVTACPMQHRPL
jgi:hypothetical protein